MSLALSVHIAVGSLALAAFWSTFALEKGGQKHRVLGRMFFVAMLCVVATVAPVLASEEAPFDPGRVVQMVYLSCCVGTVVALGWTSVRLRRVPDRFLALPVRPLGGLLLGLGCFVLLAGFGAGDPVPVVLSWVGLAFGSAMWRFASVPGLLPQRWWLSWHLDAVCGLFTAVHGTLLSVGWRWLVSPEAGRTTAALAHISILAVALVLRGWLGRRYGAPSVVFPWPSPLGAQASTISGAEPTGRS